MCDTKADSKPNLKALPVDTPKSNQPEVPQSDVVKRSEEQTVQFLNNIKNVPQNFFDNLPADNQAAFDRCREYLFTNLSPNGGIPEIAENDKAERVMCKVILDTILSENTHSSETSLKEVTENVCDITYNTARFFEVIERDTTEHDEEKLLVGSLLLKVNDYSQMAKTLIQYIEVPLQDRVKVAAEDVAKQANDAKTHADTAVTQAKKAKKNADNAVSETKGLLGQIIAILAIFTAMVFAMVGGVSSLGSVLSNPSIASNKIELAFIVCVWLVAMLAVIVLLFYLVMVVLLVLKNDKDAGSAMQNAYKMLGLLLILFVIMILIAYYFQAIAG